MPSAGKPCGDRFIGWIVCLCALTWTAQGAATEPPMISGFERFGRTDEVDETISGSLLIAELNCVSCHASGEPWLQPKRGPRLTGAGLRLNPEWLRRYLADPPSVKPGTTMPHVLRSLPEAERSKAVDALVAFLGSQQQPFAVLKAGGATPVVHEFWKRGDPERGANAYHTVGCVACHQSDPDYETVGSKPSEMEKLIDQLDPDELAELGLTEMARKVESVPHGDLNSKYSPRSLAMMLLDPANTRPSARMPSLRLSPDEAADIAAYLLRHQNSGQSTIAPMDAPQDLVAEGRRLFSQLRCAACHDATGSETSRPASGLSELNVHARSSCIEHPSGQMPRFALDNQQRSVIRSRLHAKQQRDPAAEDDVIFRMAQLNCYGCHNRDQLGGVGRYRKAYFETVGNVDLGDEGRLPPPLTGVGRKLQPKALAAVFRSNSPRHRPYMTIRMPTYSAAAVEPLLAHLPAADRVSKTNEKDVFADHPDFADAGRELVNTGCVECHLFRGESLPGVVGVDLSGITSRVDPQWFHDFVFNPGAVKDRTRMPNFFPEGKSNRKDILDGDPDRQIAAIWAYLKRLETHPLPEKIARVRSANYELTPKDRPVVLRTFMEQAGTHAIAVGFPQGVHYAFDAEQVRLAIAWKERFLDARGTWFERFTPPADPLGEPLVTLPSGPLLLADGQPDVQFLGYRLDGAGVPTLLYRFGSCSVEDRIEPSDAGGLKRRLDLRAGSPIKKLRLQAHAARRLTPAGRSAYSDDQGLTVSLPKQTEPAGSLDRSDGMVRWLIPIEIHNTTSIELEYRW